MIAHLVSGLDEVVLGVLAAVSATADVDGSIVAVVLFLSLAMVGLELSDCQPSPQLIYGVRKRAFFRNG